MGDFQLSGTVVKDCIERLGNGFLAHHKNKVLLKNLGSGELTPEKFHTDLFRLTYRLVFLFNIEDRDLLLVKRITEKQRSKFMENYSTTRLRDSTRIEQEDEGVDLWQNLLSLMHHLDQGDEEHGLPALGGFLWQPREMSSIEKQSITNANLLAAVSSLVANVDGKVEPIDWEKLMPEELGYVHEALLDHEPILELENKRIEIKSTVGAGQKNSGAYYTPSDLSEHLVKTSITPQIEMALSKEDKEDKEKALLSISVCDPSCGQGWILLPVSRKLADALAHIRSKEPTDDEIQKAKWDIVNSCIYGVDFDPMAVELCKVGLWMESMNRGKPFPLLESKIRFGNSVLGQKMENSTYIHPKSIPSFWKDSKANNTAEIKEYQSKDIAKKQKELDKHKDELADLEEPDVETLAEEDKGKRERTLELKIEKLEKEIAERPTGRNSLSTWNPGITGDDSQSDQLKAAKLKLEDLRNTPLTPSKVGKMSGTSIVDPKNIRDVKLELEVKISAIEKQLESLNQQIDIGTTFGDALKQLASEISPENMNNSEYKWAKEMMDTTMATWWWPEVGDTISRPLHTGELERYAFWLSKKYKVKGKIFGNTPKENLFRPETDEDLAVRFPIIREFAKEIAEKKCFFHWEFEFALHQNENTWGFRVMIGNPPWEQVELKEKEYFATSAPEIASAKKSVRVEMINDLEEENPSLYKEYINDKSGAEKESNFFSESGNFPLSSEGRMNFYSLFTEHYLWLLSDDGNAGLIIPTGIVADESNCELFQYLVDNDCLSQVICFDSDSPYFRGVKMQFCLLSASGQNISNEGAVFASSLKSIDEFSEERMYSLTTEDYTLLNPNTKTLVLFDSTRDFELMKSIYNNSEILFNGKEGAENLWGINFKQGLYNMSNASGYFKTRVVLEKEGWNLAGNVFSKDGERYLPLYEGKSFHQYNHRWNSYGGEKVDIMDKEARVVPENWVPEKEDIARMLKSSIPAQPIFAYRLISRGSDPRTLIATFLPRPTTGHSVSIATSTNQPRHMLALLCVFNSTLLDYVIKRKAAGANMSQYIVEQLPVVSPRELEQPCSWDAEQTYSQFLTSRVEQLIHTTTELLPLSSDKQIYEWDVERRSDLKSQIDAAVFIIYDISRGDAEYILSNFSSEQTDTEDDNEAKQDLLVDTEKILEYYDTYS